MANPPISIGPYTNVPAPGSPIASAWAQDISRETSTRRGVGLRQASISVGAGAQVTLDWPTELYDTDNYHVAGAQAVIIPANRAGLYGITLTGGPTGAGIAAVCDLIVSVGATLYLAPLVNGKASATLTLITNLAAGTQVAARIGNGGGAAAFFQATLECNYLRTLAT